MKKITKTTTKKPVKKENGKLKINLEIIFDKDGGLLDVKSSKFEAENVTARSVLTGIMALFEDNLHQLSKAYGLPKQLWKQRAFVLFMKTM